MESWLASLQSGDSLRAWDEFLDGHRRLIFSAIRQSTRDPDDVMDVFAHVCEALRANDLARLRKYPSDGSAKARFSTWLVTVVHHLTLDWFRRRDGRTQAVAPPSLTARQQEIYRLVFLESRPHIEAYELLRQRSEPGLSHRAFGEDLRVAQRAHNTSAFRPRARAVPLDASLADPGEDGEHVLQVEEARHRVNQVLAGLRNEEQVALRLFIVNEMSAAEVARVVGWPDAKAVYNRIYRLLKTLRRSLLDRGIRSGDL